MLPTIVHELSILREKVRELTAAGRTIGVVPTMGALHEGHLSLARQARDANDVVIVTIFVNPTQFGPKEDFAKYPRTLQSDVEALDGLCDLVFAPADDVVYPEGFTTAVEPPVIAQRWEGSCRPGHFRGVATVVMKLLLMTQPHRAFFGQKDYQQLRVIQQMVQDLDVPVEIVGCPTIREADGLAMSSRNQYLTGDQRGQALAISGSLEFARTQVAAGTLDPESVLAGMKRQMYDAGITQIDYVALVDPLTLEPVSRLDVPTRALIAAFVGATRLIDNDLIV